MFIEVTYCTTGRRTLVNIDKLEIVTQDKNGNVKLFWGQEDYVAVEETYEDIKMKLALAGKLK
ncbi:hypothetical protein [Oceanobacillus neutriphilus]|uniref:Uncharacterized protein n=1 Tax=Oceanobacillus neutriphilus TaxID=531815 RepID=A0ABQ2P3G3_9BACI|nr:hypothetical protein [Oceanobacillus neutriphilus]GGP17290.1 hypothetical protein GCM10011346_52570 [Oceanobacillus neutriphilus]